MNKIMAIEELAGKQLMKVQFFLDEEKVSDPISLFRNEIERRRGEYQRNSRGSVTYKVLLEGVVMNRENIEDYYVYMSDEDLRNNRLLLQTIFDERFIFLCSKLNILVQEMQRNIMYSSIENKTVGIAVFNVHDELKPIAMYAREIEKTKDYRKFKALKLWKEFSDIAIDEDECIDTKWYTFDIGTNRYEIWHWFEEKFGVSIHDDLQGTELD